MCRFVAYLGKQGKVLGDLIEKPDNSLISQSRQAREGKTGLNADGFGIGWYDHDINDAPGVYRSVQPAWNDHNLRHIASKIKSKCFIGHVRASTVGDVNIYNCHPFTHNEFAFIHNGTIQGFEQIRRRVINMLEDPFFEIIEGQTDSEHFFATLMMLVSHLSKPYTLDRLAKCMLKTIAMTNELQAGLKEGLFCRLNTVLTNGKELLVTRYVSYEEESALSLHYTLEENGIVIASEELPTYATQWVEIPVNSMVLVGADLKVTTMPLNPWSD